MITLISRIIAVVKILMWAWRNRKPIGVVFGDLDDLKLYVSLLRGAFASGTSKTNDAQSIVKSLLALPSFDAIVTATATDWDDIQLDRARDFVADNTIFTVAWKLLHKECNLNLEDDRVADFTNKLKRILPYFKPDDALVKTQGVFVRTNVQDPPLAATESDLENSMSMDSIPAFPDIPEVSDGFSEVSDGFSETKQSDVLDKDAEFGILSIISLIVTILTILPKIIAIIEKRRLK